MTLRMRPHAATRLISTVIVLSMLTSHGTSAAFLPSLPRTVSAKSSLPFGLPNTGLFASAKLDTPTHGELAHLKVVDLKAECKQRGLKVGGTKAVLIERLMEYRLSETSRTAPPEEETITAILMEDGPNTASTTSVDAPATTTATHTEDALASLKVVELRAECKQRGLPVRGKKAELIQRLLEHNHEAVSGIEAPKKQKKKKTPPKKKKTAPPPTDAKAQEQPVVPFFPEKVLQPQEEQQPVGVPFFAAATQVTLGGKAQEKARLEAEEEKARKEAEDTAKRAEEERLAAEAAKKAEEERLAAEAEATAQKIEEERMAAEAAMKAEVDRLAAEVEAAKVAQAATKKAEISKPKPATPTPTATSAEDSRAETSLVDDVFDLMGILVQNAMKAPIIAPAPAPTPTPVAPVPVPVISESKDLRDVKELEEKQPHEERRRRQQEAQARAERRQEEAEEARRQAEAERKQRQAQAEEARRQAEAERKQRQAQQELERRKRLEEMEAEAIAAARRESETLAARKAKVQQPQVLLETAKPPVQSQEAGEPAKVERKKVVVRVQVTEEDRRQRQMKQEAEMKRRQEQMEQEAIEAARKELEAEAARAARLKALEEEAKAKESEEREAEAQTTLAAIPQAQEDSATTEKQVTSEADVADNTTPVDLSIPYDAAAKLAYEAAGCPGDYSAFKEKFEADAVANIIAKTTAQKTLGETNDQAKARGNTIDSGKPTETGIKGSAIAGESAGTTTSKGKGDAAPAKAFNPFSTLNPFSDILPSYKATSTPPEQGEAESKPDEGPDTKIIMNPSFTSPKALRKSKEEERKQRQAKQEAEMKRRQDVMEQEAIAAANKEMEAQAAQASRSRAPEEAKPKAPTLADIGRQKAASAETEENETAPAIQQKSLETTKDPAKPQDKTVNAAQPERKIFDGKGVAGQKKTSKSKTTNSFNPFSALFPSYKTESKALAGSNPDSQDESEANSRIMNPSFSSPKARRKVRQEERK